MRRKLHTQEQPPGRSACRSPRSPVVFPEVAVSQQGSNRLREVGGPRMWVVRGRQAEARRPGAVVVEAVALGVGQVVDGRRGARVPSDRDRARAEDVRRHVAVRVLHVRLPRDLRGSHRFDSSSRVSRRLAREVVRACETIVALFVHRTAALVGGDTLRCSRAAESRPRPGSPPSTTSGGGRSSDTVRARTSSAQSTPSHSSTMS